MQYIRIHQEEERIESGLMDFILALPYLLSQKDKLIPPIKVLNEICEAGVLNAGMSGIYEWTPFTITPDNYSDLLAELSKKGFLLQDVPEWVITRDDWLIWKGEYLYGIPSKEHKQLLDEEKKLSNQYKDALKKGATEIINELADKHMRAKVALAEFLNKY